MSPLEIWCNESRERYVLAVAADQLPLFDELCRRERAPYAVIGEATEEKHLTLSDTHFDNQPIDLPLDVLLGKTPKMTRDVQTRKAAGKALDRRASPLQKRSTACCTCRRWQRKPSWSPLATVP